MQHCSKKKNYVIVYLEDAFVELQGIRNNSYKNDDERITWVRRSWLCPDSKA